MVFPRFLDPIFLSKFLDATKQQVLELQVKDISQQNEFETRKAWLKVAEAIKLGDYELIHKEKSEIEINQRIYRKEKSVMVRLGPEDGLTPS